MVCQGVFGTISAPMINPEPNKSLNRLTFLPFYEPNTCYNQLMTSNWQQKDWPEFRYDLSGADDALLAFAERTGRASGLLKGLPEDARAEAAVELMVAE